MNAIRLLSTLLFLLFVFGCICGSAKAACSDPNEFQCDNGKCIVGSWRCDRYFDCEDDSDEVGCGHTCKPTEFICDDGSCIDGSWKCDGDSDCRSGSDESSAICRTHTCPANEWKCPKGVCILESWKCDGEDDCEDGGDEEGCPTAGSCTQAEFRCANGNCISSLWTCDGDDDCGDYSDESNETCTRMCAANQFTCNNGQCIPTSWKCDREDDCTDASDESHCPTDGPSSPPTSSLQCPSDQRPCKDGRLCYHIKWNCDKEHDCFDGSDEHDCPSPAPCSGTEYQCQSGACIDKKKICNGNRDCLHGDDELNCSVPTSPAPVCVNGFLCSNGTCLSSSHLCDGIADCFGGEDEQSCRVNECSSPTTNNCTSESEECVDDVVGYHCSCIPGYSRQDGQCKDENECLLADTCHQGCLNVRGSYKCRCFPGFEPIATGGQRDSERECTAIAPEPYIIYVHAKAIYRTSLLGGTNPVKLVEGLHSPVALDYDYENQFVYWADNAKRAIYRSKLQLQSAHEVIIDGATVMQTVDGIAFDWIHRQLFWTDSGTNKILKFSFDHKTIKTVIGRELDEPRAIVVDPVGGHIYFSDWGDIGKIERANLEGKERMVLVKDGVEWPDGLSLDLNRGFLYWIDSLENVVRRSDLLGNDVKILWSKKIERPFGFDVFLDKFYFTERKLDKEAVVTGRVDGLGELEFVQESLLTGTPLGLKVVHQSKQITEPQSRDPCHKDNGGCLDVCKNEGNRAVCGCHRSDDELVGRACLPKIRCNKENGGCSDVCETAGRQVTCECPDTNYTLGSDGKKCELKPEYNPCYQNNRGCVKACIPIGPREYVCDCEIGQSNCKVNQLSSTPLSAGVIAGVVIGCVVLVIVGIIVVIFFIRRGSGKHEVHFENPAYSVDDQMKIEKIPIPNNEVKEPPSTSV